MAHSPRLAATVLPWAKVWGSEVGGGLSERPCLMFLYVIGPRFQNSSARVIFPTNCSEHNPVTMHAFATLNSNHSDYMGYGQNQCSIGVNSKYAVRRALLSV